MKGDFKSFKLLYKWPSLNTQCIFLYRYLCSCCCPSEASSLVVKSLHMLQGSALDLILQKVFHDLCSPLSARPWPYHTYFCLVFSARLLCFPFWLMTSCLKPFVPSLVPLLYLQEFITRICLYVLLSLLDPKISKDRDCGLLSLSPPSTGLNKWVIRAQKDVCLFEWPRLEDFFSGPKQCLFLLGEPPTSSPQQGMGTTCDQST